MVVVYFFGLLVLKWWLREDFSDRRDVCRVFYLITRESDSIKKVLVYCKLKFILNEFRGWNLGAKVNGRRQGKLIWRRI